MRLIGMLFQLIITLAMLAFIVTLGLLLFAGAARSHKSGNTSPSSYVK